MAYCTNCGTSVESGSHYCTRCGGLLTASADRRRTSPGWLLPVLIALGVLLVGAGGAAAWATLRGGNVGGTGTPPTALPSPAGSDPARNNPPGSPLVSAQATAAALCVSGASQDAGHATVTYEPEKAVDGALDTAWRCDGDGVGQRLELTFPGTVTLTSVGLVPGYAKTDPSDGTDRYVQNRRITAVRYTFDDNSAVTQSFDIGASARSVQTITLPAVSTSHVTITILGSEPGDVSRGQPPVDKVAISEVTFSAR